MRSRKLQILCAFVVALSAMLIFSNAMNNGFVWDDDETLPFAAGIERVPSWRQIFLSPVDRLYRPLRTLSLIADYYAGGGGASAYHLTNILLHSSNSVLVFMLVIQLSSSIHIALFSSLLFAVHPLHVETVSWISGGRADLLSCFFGLLAIVFYMLVREKVFSRKDAKHAKKILYMFSLISFCLALLSKENAAVIPVLLLCLTPFQKMDRFIRKSAITIVPFFIVLVLYVWLRTSAIAETQQMFGYHGGSLRTTLITMSTVVVSYITDALMPVRLCPLYTVKIQQGFSISVILAVALIIALTMAIFTALFRGKLWGFGIAWFVICILPVSNIIPINALKADRFMYFPSIGIFIIISCFLHRVLLGTNGVRENKPAYATAFFALTAACVILLAALTVRTIPIWKNNYSLWTHTTHCAPDSWIAFNNLGTESYSRGDSNGAITALKKAAQLNPNREIIYNNLADIYGVTGNYSLALENLEISAGLNPDNAETYYKMGFALEKSGKFQEAQKNYEIALAKSGDNNKLRAASQNAIRHLNESRKID
ncbi:MAG: tetratricopeptide repeat protein [bacterium]